MLFVLASNNEHKLKEFKRILEPLGIKIITKTEAKANEFNPEETADTFSGNAEIKAAEMARISNLPSIADDSGLMIDELNGEPGVYSARYAGENATDEEKYNLVLKKLKNIPAEKRSARFVSSICCIFPKSNMKIKSEGYCEGKIAFESKGKNGFGYDPVFLPDRYDGNKSFAQLEDYQKDEISHRGMALKKFAEKMKKALKEINDDNQ